MICHKCGTADVTGSTCPSCKAPLGRRCPACSFENVAESRYCGGCGRGLEEAQTEDSEGELRQISCLFIDLVGSTELSQSLEPEDLRDHLAGYQRACNDAVANHGGHVAQFLGDGVVVYFGYPRSHEDDAQRAVRCALDIIEEIEHLNDDPSSVMPIRVRLGLHTGRVIVGPVGAGDRTDRIALGDTPNIAARLEGIAEVGTVAVSATTWQLVESAFVGRNLGAHSLRGVKEPVDVWIVEARASASGFPREAVAVSPLLGRQHELDTLRALIEDGSAAGRFQVVAVRGEAGIGKSRLVRQLVVDVQQSGHAVLLTRSTPALQGSPFAPIRNLLEGQLRLAEASDEIVAIQAVLEGVGLMSDTNLMLVADLLGVELPDSVTPLELTAARRRVLTMDLLVDLITRSARDTPTVAVIEDFHWADASTHEWLERLLAAQPAVPLHIVLPIRPTLQAPWFGHPDVRVVELERLDADTTASLAAAIAGGKALPHEVVDAIIERSEGVPLFVEELTRSVLASGQLREGSTTWEATATLDQSFIPASVDSSLTARIDSIGGSRATAQLAAAIGRDFDVRLLEAVSPREAETVASDVRAMIAAGLVREVEPGGTMLRFRHALLRDAAYNTLLRATRRSYHQLIAEGLAARPDMIDWATLAHHQQEAGDFANAADSWLAAAMSDLATSSLFEAAAHMANAIRCVSELEPTDEVKTRELELQSQIWPLWAATEGWGSASVEAACVRGLELAGELERYDLIYVPMWGLWTVYFLRGQMGQAIETAHQVHEMAQAAGNPMIALTGEHALGYSHLFRGELDAAAAAAERGLALFDLDQERIIADTFQLASSLALLAIRGDVHYLQGRVRDAERDWDRLRQLADDLEHPPSQAAGLAFLLHSGALRCSWEDSTDLLIPLIDELITVTEGEGSLLWNAVARCFDAATTRHSGSAPTGTAWAAFAMTGSELTEVLTRVLFATRLHSIGDDDAASRELDLAEQAARERDEWLLAPEIWRIRGRIAAGAGRTDDAIAAYDEAIRLASRQGATMLILRALIGRYDVEAPDAQAIARAAIADLLPSIDGDGAPEVVRARQIIDSTVHDER